MSSRFPSLTQMSRMTDNDRSFTIQRALQDIHLEFNGISSGDIMPWDGSTKASLIKANRARHNRVKAALYFDIEMQ